MKIAIKSRAEIEDFAFPTKSALISITDYDYDFAELRSQPDYILQLVFDDIDSDVFVDELGRTPTDAERKHIELKYHMMTDEQAQQITDFYNKVSDTVDILICQCEHGQSRSAAVAAAIMEYAYGNGIEVFADERYYPNKTIFNKVLKQLRNG